MLWCKMAYNDYAIGYAHLLRGDYMNGSQGEATKKSAFGRRIDAFKVRHEAVAVYNVQSAVALCYGDGPRRIYAFKQPAVGGT